DDDAAVFVRDRLVPAGEIDDAEPPHAEPHAAFDERPPIIGPAVDDRVAHPEHAIRGGGTGTDQADDAAHRVSPPSSPTRPSCSRGKTESGSRAGSTPEAPGRPRGRSCRR